MKSLALFAVVVVFAVIFASFVGHWLVLIGVGIVGFSLGSINGQRQARLQARRTLKG